MSRKSRREKQTSRAQELGDWGKLVSGDGKVDFGDGDTIFGACVA